MLAPVVLKRLPRIAAFLMVLFWGLYFLLHINDIRTYSDKLKFYLFADDTISNNNLKSLEMEVNVELNKPCESLTGNKLTLDHKKSNYVIFRNHQQ